jgi:hypothetical protein
VGLCLGGLDSNSNGQEVPLVQRKEAAIADARDVKTNVFLEMKINY